MAYRIQIRNGNASEWISVNPVLMEGELAVEKDTRKFKIGDGISNWNNLPYATMGATGKAIEFDWSGTQLGIRQEGTPTFEYVNLKGEQGPKGNPGTNGTNGQNLQFNWNGTELGVRVEGDSTYIYQDIRGPAGSIDNLDATNIQDALGYIPLKPSGGVLGAYTEELLTTTGAINLTLGNNFYRNATANTTFTVTNVKAKAHSFSLFIQMGATARTLTFPASFKWVGKEIPDMTEPNTEYLVSCVTRDSGVTWLCNGGDY